jgi:hypothetical protein
MYFIFVGLLINLFGSCSGDQLVEELRAKAAVTYEKLRPCLLKSNHTKSIGTNVLEK